MFGPCRNPRARGEPYRRKRSAGEADTRLGSGAVRVGPTRLVAHHVRRGLVVEAPGADVVAVGA